ncbi:ATP-binding protein [Cellulomonas hominis]
MSTPFVARETQVAQLRAAVERAGHGDPTLVLLGADAGVGKSRLLQHTVALAEHSGATTLVTHCVDLGEIGLPYLPFADALARLVAVGGDEVARAVESRPALARLLPADGSDTPAVVDDASRLQLFDEMATVLAAAGRPGAPLVLVVEDLHWADSSSRDLLRFLVARLRNEHVLLVASYRADDLHRRHPLRPVLAEMARHPRVERIELAPFTPAELRDFTTALLGSPLTDATFAEVVQRSEGNAFFAEELLESGTADPALPWTLSEVLSARLEPLDPVVQQVARVAAVAGRRVSEPLLRAVLDAQGADVDLDATLREAVAHHVLVGEDGRIAFRHALLAEAVYGDLLPGEQVALHRDYLQALTAAPELGSPAQIAHHALHSHDLPTALRASRAAALDARRVLAPLEELRHLETVLRLWSAVPTAAQDLGETRTDVLLAAATAASRAGGVDRAVALAREAVDGPDAPPAREAELRTALARHLLAVDRVDDALAETALALRVLGAGTGGPDAPAAGAGDASGSGAAGTGMADGTDDATVADRARPWPWPPTPGPR